MITMVGGTLGIWRRRMSVIMLCSCLLCGVIMTASETFPPLFAFCSGVQPVHLLPDGSQRRGGGLRRPHADLACPQLPVRSSHRYTHTLVHAGTHTRTLRHTRAHTYVHNGVIKYCIHFFIICQLKTHTHTSTDTHIYI